MHSPEDNRAPSASPPSTAVAEGWDRTLFGRVSVGVIYQARDGTILDANPEAQRILGLTLGQLREQPSTDPRWASIREDGAPLPGSEHPSIVALRTGHVIRDAVMGLRRGDGAIRWIRVDAFPEGPEGQPADRVLVTFTDVTDRVDAERLLRTLFDTIPESVFMMDATGVVLAANATMCARVGHPREAVVGRCVLDLLPDAIRERRRRWIETVVRTGQPFVEVDDRDGLLLQHHICPVFGADGAVDRLVVFAVDITQRQATENALRQSITERREMEAQLRQAQKLEAIGQLAGGVAHDFNNILAVAMMHIGLLQARPDLDDGLRAAVEELDVEMQRAANLTRQLLMFSRRSVLELRPLDLDDLVANLLKMLRRLVGEHVDLRLDARTALPTVLADPGMIEQVLMNLVVNARDAMPQGGRITITTALEVVGGEPGAGRAAGRAGRFACLTVSDTGSGMDAETMGRIFEPFFTTKESGRGTGLGLATVHGIVAQHDGWVEVESQLGRGTAFRVYLPTHDGETAVAGPVPPGTGLPRGTETILLVEDEAAVRRMVARSLTELGYRVLEAGNGRDALALWATHAPAVDLLFTDVVMPEGVTGLDLCERMQAAKPGLRVILSSGYNTEMVQEGIPARPGITYLPKPYEIRQMARAVRSCLDRR